MRSMVWAGILVGAVVGLGSSSIAQNRPRFIPPMESRVAPEIDRRVEQALDDSRSLISRKQFGPAVNRLQTVLNHGEDYFLEKDFRSGKPPQASVRAQVLGILAELPAEGQAAYESQFGLIARDLLKKGISTNDAAQVSQVVTLYAMTDAGFDALQFLTANAFDHDQPLEAAFLCESMLIHPRAKGAIRGPLLLQSAFAWHLAGQSERSLAALEAATTANKIGPWRLGGRGVALMENLDDAPNWMKTQISPVRSTPTNVVTSWTLPRGGLTGNESATPSAPVGGGLWSISSRKYLRLQSDPKLNQQRIEAFDDLIHQVEQTIRDNNRLFQPAAIPLVVSDVVVYRTLNDITAVSLQTGRLLWRSSTTDGMLSWLFQSSFATSDSIPSSSLLTFRGYLRYKMFRDQLSGSLSSDGNNVYAVEESESQFSPMLPRSRLANGVPLFLEPTNKLAAYEISGGRLAWEVGGQSGTPPVELSGYFFLGPPLPFSGRLYCLAESKNELRLISLIPESKTARLEWTQPLIITDRAYLAAPRRMAGLVPAITDGIAVCPTANGSVVAFDLVHHQLRWGYSYDAISRRNLQIGSDFISGEEEDRWLETGPIIANGHVIVTPRDSPEIHCLNLVDGSLVWKRLRDQGLFVACVNEDAVILVGRSQITALSLVDGSDVWSEPIVIPEPSGRGVRMETRYLLPLSTGEIVSIDLVAGRILGRSKMSDGLMPGNLAVGAGALVSCGTHNVVGFRSLADVEQQVPDKLKVDPSNAEALALRAEVELHRGHEQAAINDLRLSLKQQPNLQVKRVLAEILLNRMRHDPQALLKSVPELEFLTDDQRQRIEFLRLYSKALGDTGSVAGAATQLVRLGTQTLIPDELISLGEGHFISLKQSIRSQLFALYESADANQRSAIRDAFGKELDAMWNSADREQRFSRFVTLVVSHPAADAVLLRLATSKDGLADVSSRIRLLERLTRTENRSTAATAVAALAAGLLQGDRREDALPWIEKLRSNYSQDVCLDGKTGRQLSDEWLARGDLRQRKITKDWPEGRIDIQRTEEITTQAIFPVDIATRVGHQFEGWTFETDSQVAILTARDPSLSVAWRLPLPNSTEELRGQPSQIHICGRRLAFSSGTWLAVMEARDPNGPPDIMFNISLRPNSLSIARSVDPPLERRLLPNGRRFQLLSDVRGTSGFLLGLTDDAVCYQLDNRLYVVDSDSGRVLWSRTGQLFAKSDGTINDFLVLNTSTNGAVLLRSLDGTLHERIQGNAHDMPLWFRGTRRLSQRSVSPDQRLFEMRDFDGDQVVWQSQFAAASQPCIIDDEELGILEPNGRFSIVNIATGKTHLSTELPAKRPQKGAGVLAVQRYKDRYLVVAGVNSKNTERRVTPLNIGVPKEFGVQREFGPPPEVLGTPSIAAFTVDGFVCSVARSDGKLQWSVPVADLAFDTSQVSTLPVLVLASLQTEVDRFAGFPLSPRLSVLVLDKKTGKKLYEKLESNIPVGRGVQFNPMVDEGKLVIDFYNWQLNLNFVPAK